MPDDPLRDPETLERIFHAALADGDVEGVGHVLTAMSGVDPRRMVSLANELKEALTITRFLRGEASPHG